MKAFALPPDTRLKITKATPRKETHGKELVQAISLRVEWWPADNEALNILHPNLQSMLFWTPPEIEAQMALDGLPPVKKHLRVPTAQRPVKVGGSLSGYTLTIEHGISADSALELYDCELDKFETDPKEGGAAPIRWSVASNKQLTPELVGLLCSLEGEEVVAGLEPPKLQEGQTIDGTGAEFKRDHPEAQGDLLQGGEDSREAGDAFADAVQSDRHAGDFGQADGEGGPGAGDSDDTAGASGGDGGADGAEARGDNWPFPIGNDGAADAAAEFEAGASAALAAAGVKPKGRGKGTRKTAPD